MATFPKIAVAMSGGVDSSVAAALLVEQGYPVVGLMLRLWSEPGQEDSNRCCTPDALAQARRVAAQLGIPFFAIDARERFRETVVQAFLDGYAGGITPNPCVTCNRQIRWGLLLKHALALGAEKMATGHYARLVQDGDGRTRLLKGRDDRKDQAYVLSQLTQEQLGRTLLPVGDLEKPAVRELAKRFNLPVAERPDSQDLCFLAGQDYREFLTRNAPELRQAGPILNQGGETIGMHEGLAFYTIGQRKGLGIAAAQPLYVTGKDPARNALLVGTAADLGRTTLTAGGLNWIAGEPPAEKFKAEVKIRYKAQPAAAELTLLAEGKVEVVFEKPLRDITPGQLAAFYAGEDVLGSGFIETIEGVGQK